MAALTESQKVYVIQALACFMSPTETADAVMERFGIEIKRQHVQHYDPTVGPPPAQKWIDLFWESRKKYLEETEGIPIAYKAYRLRELQKMHDEAMRISNYPLSREVLEQAAKEMGDAYTNRKQISGPGGGPIHHSVTGSIDLKSLTNEQLQRIADGEDPADVVGSES